MKDLNWSSLYSSHYKSLISVLKNGAPRFWDIYKKSAFTYKRIFFVIFLVGSPWLHFTGKEQSANVTPPPPKTIMTMEHPPLKKMHVLLKKGIFQKVMLVFWLYLPFQSLTIYLQRRGPSHPQQVPGRELMVTEDHTRCILVKQFYEFRFIESSFCFLIFTSGLSCRRRFTWMICPSPNSG